MFACVHHVNRMTIIICCNTYFTPIFDHEQFTALIECARTILTTLLQVAEEL
jgi:hypothetical protein